MLKDRKSKNNILLSSEEEKLFKKYLEEYHELYQKILILTPNDFIQSMKKRVEISMKEKINGFSNTTKSKIEDLIIERIYCRDYKYALFAKKKIINRKKTEINTHYFNNQIIPHCEKDKKNGYYIHTCGEKFQTYKYKPINYSLLVKYDKNNLNNNEYDFLLYCMECDMIYKSDLIKFKCFFSNECFYSKILDNNDLKNNNHLVTWKKYHCNIIINDAMKCQKCNENLYYLKDKNNIFCKKCNMEFDPKKLKWKCMKCKADFIAEVKIFNPLEYKNLKICVKETIFNKKKAKPNYLGCGCKIEFKNLDFFHKNSCKGKLFLGKLNDKKVVVCDKCESLGMYNDYIWTCPKCLKRFKINKNQLEKKEENNKKGKENNKENINDNNNEEKIKKQISRFFNYSNSNWNIKINNHIGIYKSPRLKTKLLLPPKSDIDEKENKSDNKKLGYICRNNSAAKFVPKRKCPSGLPSPSKLIKDIKKNYNIKLENINLNNMNKLNLPNYSPNVIHSKLESKIFENKIFSSKNNISSQKRNKLISNIDLTEIKNLNIIFNKYFGATPKETLESKNNNYVISRNENYNIKNRMLTDYDLGDKAKNNSKYKKKFLNHFTKVINQTSSNNNNSNNNNNKNLIIRKRCNSGCNSIKIKNDDPIPINKNNIKNSPIGNINKIPIKKNIINNTRKIFNKRGEDSTSSDSKENISKNNNSKVRNSPIKKNEENVNHINKKIVPGKFNINDYIIKKQIGEGSFGQIFLVEDKKHNKYALKKIIAGSSGDIESIQQEYQILIDIQNSNQVINVVNIYGITKYKLDATTYVLYVLMELASTDWEKEILKRKDTKKYYSEKELMDILSTLIKSLSILQKQNISHRDIKPQNILVFSDKILNKTYKLADFGEAKELLKNVKPTNKQTLRGTELYMSPILFYALRGRKMIKYIQHNPYKSDVFSFGLCSLFAATLCFESLYDVRELRSNVSLRVVVQRYLKYKYSQDVINIITKMLDVNEVTRMDFVELEKEFNKLGY